LLDLSNLFANAHNLNFSSSEYLEELPLQRLTYVHLAGGTFKRGLYHDTHSHPLQQQSLLLLEELAKHMPKNGAISRVMLERDDSFPSEDELNGELDAIVAVLQASAPATEHHSAEVGQKIGHHSISLSPAGKSSSTAAEVAAADVALCMRQEELVKSLLRMAAVPEWLDEKRIHEAAEALSRKRLRTIKRAHQALDKHLPAVTGPVETDPDKRLDRALRSYFAAFPSVHPDGCYADSLAFLKFMKTQSA